MSRRPAPRPDPNRNRPATLRSGARGEDLAAAALAHAGYRIVARNLRTRFGELDLLVRRGRTWIAVEVKARADHPAPERHVTPERLSRLERALSSLVPDLRPRPRGLRIDVVAVRWLGDLAEILHFPAFRTVADGSHGIARSDGLPAATGGLSNSSSSRRAPIRLPMPTLAEQILPRRKVLLMLCETALLTTVLMVGTSLPPLGKPVIDLFAPSQDLLRGLLSCFTVALICQASLSYNDLYDWRTAQNRAELGNRLVHSAGYAMVMMAILGVVANSLFYFPGLAADGLQTYKLILLLVVAFSGVYALRHALHWFFYKWRFGERILVLGSSQEALQLAKMVMDSPLAGYELIGLIAEPDHPAPPVGPGQPPVLGDVGCLRALCRREGISRVVVALRERRGRVPVSALLEARMDGVMIEEREAMFERLTGKLALESMKPSYLIYGRGFAKDRLTMVLKRVLDILASSVGLLLSLPVCLIAIVLIKLTSKGPIFFRQERVGQDGETFHVVKFRTMRADAEKESGPVWAQKNDSRVTPVGKILRLSRIDEIPQFLNILTGHMSFVGPRPERQHFVEQLKAEIPFYPLRHTVKPGLTGWAQVRHPYGASVEDAREKLRYDLYYIKNMSFLFDLNIIARTVGVILLGKGAR